MKVISAPVQEVWNRGSMGCLPYSSDFVDGLGNGFIGHAEGGLGSFVNVENRHHLDNLAVGVDVGLF